MTSINILLVFVILGAIIAIEVKNLLSSVIAVGGVGLGTAMAFILLKAPDVAIVQLVVEILCVVFLIRATIKRDIIKKPEPGLILHTLVVLVFIAIFLFFTYQALQEIPVFGEPTMKLADYYHSQGRMDTGAVNLVASVILDYRAYDTLGEATILFTAVIGVLAIMRKKGRIEEQSEEE